MSWSRTERSPRIGSQQQPIHPSSLSPTDTHTYSTDKPWPPVSLPPQGASALPPRPPTPTLLTLGWLSVRLSRSTLAVCFFFFSYLAPRLFCQATIERSFLLRQFVHRDREAAWSSSIFYHLNLRNEQHSTTRNTPIGHCTLFVGTDSHACFDVVALLGRYGTQWTIGIILCGGKGNHTA